MGFLRYPIKQITQKTKMSTVPPQTQIPSHCQFQLGSTCWQAVICVLGDQILFARIALAFHSLPASLTWISLA